MSGSETVLIIMGVLALSYIVVGIMDCVRNSRMGFFKYLWSCITGSVLVIFHPGSWTCINLYSEETDTILRKYLKDPHFSNLEDHTIELNGIVFWRANAPYNTAYPYPGKTKRPSRAMMIRFTRAVKKFKDSDVIEKAFDKEEFEKNEISAEYFGGMPLKEVQALVKEKYPENFV
jgi:hypothetical protein